MSHSQVINKEKAANVDKVKNPAGSYLQRLCPAAVQGWGDIFMFIIHPQASINRRQLYKNTKLSYSVITLEMEENVITTVDEYHSGLQVLKRYASPVCASDARNEPSPFVDISHGYR